LQRYPSSTICCSATPSLDWQASLPANNVKTWSTNVHQTEFNELESQEGKCKFIRKVL
jgi:hypothetical protein